MDYSTLPRVLTILRLTECAIGLMTNGLGLFAICVHKKKSKQTLILSSLSVVEILFILVYVNAAIMALCEEKNIYAPNSVHTIQNIATSVVMFQLLFIMFILTTDKLLCIVTPLKYKVHVRRRHMKVMIALSWFLSSVLGTVQWSIPGIDHIMMIVIIALGSLYIVFIVVAYAMIIHTVKRSRRRYSSRNRTNSDRQDRQGIRYRKDLWIPSLIILTCVLFHYVPFLVRMFAVDGSSSVAKNRRLDVLVDSCKLVQCFALLVDPVIYVMLTKAYRDILVRTLCCGSICFFCKKTSEMNNNSSFHIHSTRTNASSVRSAVEVFK